MDAEETTAFMKSGGRLAILDDYGLGDETLRRFHIERTSAPSRPVAALRNASPSPPCRQRNSRRPNASAAVSHPRRAAT